MSKQQDIFNDVLDSINALKNITQNNANLIDYITQISHTKLIDASIEKEKIDELIEDCQYEEVISKLMSIIECLEGGYCNILNKIEGVE